MAYRQALFATICVLSGATVAFAEDGNIRVSASAKAACMPDAIRLCRDAVPNVQNVLVCFGQNREKISNRCRTVLASYGLN